MMVWPGVAPVPLSVGVVSSVALPVVSRPCTEPTSSVTVKAGVVGVPGAAGACGSRAMGKLAGLALPVWAGGTSESRGKPQAGYPETCPMAA